MKGFIEKYHIQLYYSIGFIVLSVVALITVTLLNKTGTVPLGADTFGHLYKAERLYNQIRQGEWLLAYDAHWYNGIQPFRYWAPIPYYIIAFLNFFVEDIQKAYDLFVMGICVVGGMGFVAWGRETKRYSLGIILGILWFFMPNNIRVLFAEGNLPFVIVITCVPYILLVYIKSLTATNKFPFVALAVWMAFITMNHAMLTAMTGIVLCLYGIVWALVHKAYKPVVKALTCGALGVFTMSFWLIPALEGGIMSLTSEAAVEVMKSLAYPLATSLNPLERLMFYDIFYFGLGSAVVIVVGLLFTYKKEKIPFWIAAFILIGTTPIAADVLGKLPFGQLLWMYRFTSIAMCLILIGILIWKKLRKSILILCMGVLVIDGLSNYAILGKKGEINTALEQVIEQAIEVSDVRVALLDLSHNDAYPSYRFMYNPQGKPVKQVYGWAWQGAATGENIVLLNTALEMNYYGIMFDRALELGADTIIIPNYLVADQESLAKWAEQVGYEKVATEVEYSLYKYPVTQEFGTKVTYKGLLIGDKSENIGYMFPTCMNGESGYIDDYTVEELTTYQAIFLSGHKWHNKKAAEQLLNEVASSGTKIIIDTVGQEDTLYDVHLQPIQVDKTINQFIYEGEELVVEQLPKAYEDFRVNFIAEDLPSDNYAVIGTHHVSYVKNHHPNMSTVALNLPYYAYLTKDESLLAVLEDLSGLTAYALPKREVVPIEVEMNEKISITAPKDTVVPIAYIEDLKPIVGKGNIDVLHHLIVMEEEHTELEIEEGTTPLGWAMSGIAVIALVVIIVWKKESIQELEEEEVAL